MTNIYIVGALVLSLAASGVLMNTYIEEKAEHAVTQAELLNSKEAINRYAEAVKLMGEEQQVLTAKLNTLGSENRVAEATLESYRGRESVIVAKPGLITIKINKAYKKQQDKLSCLTGALEKCIK